VGREIVGSWNFSWVEFFPRRSWKRHPLEATSPIVFSRRRRVHRAAARLRCAAEVSAPGAPIDNRWNKKLEFVYSLVTQIRAAARHPRPTLSKPSPASRPTTTADISDQHEPAFPLPTTLSATTSVIVGEHTSSRTKPCAVPIPAESRVALPKRQWQLHRQTTYTQSPSPTRRPYTRRSYHFIFPHFSLPARRFVPSDEFAELLARPGPECICQTVKQIGRQLTNTSASLAAAHSSAT